MSMLKWNEIRCNYWRSELLQREHIPLSIDKEYAAMVKDKEEPLEESACDNFDTDKWPLMDR
jgi:hypothetical protein